MKYVVCVFLSYTVLVLSFMFIVPMALAAGILRSCDKLNKWCVDASYWFESKEKS